MPVWFPRRGKIRLDNHLEVMVTDHCNLTCESCDHASPIMPERYQDPGQLEKDLSIMSRYYQPAGIKLIGGEPLLHPDLGGLLSVIRHTAIADRIKLVTNGTLLGKLDDKLLQELDTVEISIYPSAKLRRTVISSFQDRARAHNTRVVLVSYDNFRSQFSIPGSSDPALVRQVYRTCKRSQVWYCHAVYDGYFYKCPQSIYLQKFHPALEDDTGIDRLKIENTRYFARHLKAFIHDTKPLASCRYCLGTVGKAHAHAMAPPDKWMQAMVLPLEQLVDMQAVRRLNHNPRGDLGYKNLTDINDARLRGGD